MSKKLRYILIFLVLAIVFALATWLYVFRKSPASVASEKTDLTITASELVMDYETNEDSANARFVNKIILVSGKINTISGDSTGYTVYLKEDDALSGVSCRFDPTSLDTSLIKAGTQVKIKGRCNGYNFDVEMNKCSLSKE